MLTKKEGREILGIARDSIALCFDGRPYQNHSRPLSKNGVFVTLKENGELRGCVGFIKSEMPLWKSVSEAARLSAFEDGRFPALKREEFNKILIEISVLTEPKLIKRNGEITKKIKIGKDGLIIEHQWNSGLLLPQVAEEYKWNSKEFLDNACIKAGLNRHAWKEEGCRIYKFQCRIFSE